MNDVTDAGAIFRQRLDEVAADLERLLERLLDDTPLAEERARPNRLTDSMRYVSLAGGKRLRPFLVVETAALFRAP
jgi:farnesyl diphosphate synthase